MTIDEAIKREEETAADFRSRAEYFCTVENRKMSIKYAEEHEQIAKWLDELKCYKDENLITVHLSPDIIEQLKEKYLKGERT